MGKQHTQGFLDLVNAAKAHIKENNVAIVHEKQEKGDNFALIDVREDREWVAGHLPGAIHIGKGVIERDIERMVPDRATEIVLYCGGGYRSAIAAEVLEKMGYEDVTSMDGGFGGWLEAGYPIETAE